MNFQNMMQMMKFISQFKNGNANQQIDQLVSSGKVSQDMLTEARRRADMICQAFGIKTR